MSRSEATLERLLQLLPAMDELEVLRLNLIGAAVPNPERAWDSSSAYTTIDKRILGPEEVDRALQRAEGALLEYVRSIHGALRPVFRSYFAEDIEGAARHLLALGDQLDAGGRSSTALQCFRSALHLSLPLPAKSCQIQALRRLGRVSLALGDVVEAGALYERCAEMASDSGDHHGEVVARTGIGNVSLFQGRWAQAEEAYGRALALTDAAPHGEMVIERAQLFNNLGHVSTRLGRLDDGQEWLDRAMALWKELDSPADTAICHINLGHLREQQGRVSAARAEYEKAIQLAIPPSLKSLLAADIAQAWLTEGYVSRAEEMARVAEAHAIASGSPYSLAYMYNSLGNLARCRGDDDGFVFFEKALEIARQKGFLSLEGEILADYADLRRANGGAEEAEAYLERARGIFAELQVPHSLARVERTLDELRADRSRVSSAAD